MVLRVESWGVVPPEEYEVHSSRRDAPEDAAVRAEDSVKTAISSMFFVVVWMEESVPDNGDGGKCGEEVD